LNALLQWGQMISCMAVLPVYVGCWQIETDPLLWPLFLSMSITAAA